MASKNFDISTLFAGGRLCLDFINTSCQVVDVMVELIDSPEELRRWLDKAESVTGKSLSPADDAWEPGYGEAALPRAIELRTALRDIIMSLIEETPFPTAALNLVNTLLRANPIYSQIGISSAGFQESIQASNTDDRWLIAIAQDAVDMLCHSDQSLLRQCECPTCIRVFYDTTKNHKRRWCVEKCGSKPKAAAYYRRKVAKANLAKGGD